MRIEKDAVFSKLQEGDSAHQREDAEQAAFRALEPKPANTAYRTSAGWTSDASCLTCSDRDFFTSAWKLIFTGS